MLFSKTIKMRALSGAERTLGTWNKSMATIAAGEQKLLKLIQHRVTAERAAVAAETDAALSEQTEASTEHQRVIEALCAIDRQASVLAGLRSRAAAQSRDLESQARAIHAELPEFVAALKADFAGEWQKGLVAFEALLGKRAALEGFIGKLDLPVPHPASGDVGDVAAGCAPWRWLDALQNALEVVAGWSRSVVAPSVDAMMDGGGRHFDERAVYVLTRNHDNWPVGTMVMEASFVPGLLEHLCRIGYAVTLASQEWEATLEPGRQAAYALESTAREESGRVSTARLERYAREQAAAVPLALQRPSVEETDPDYQRKRELAEGRRSQQIENPPHVGTVS